MTAATTIGTNTRPTTEVTSCPACGGIDSAQVGAEATAFDSVAGGHSFHHPAYGIRHCAHCGLYFKSRTLAGDELDLYYERLESATFEIDGNFPTDQILRGALDRLPAGSRVLDFGCSTGRILKGLIGRLDCVGVEPNEQAAAAARARGIRIVTEQELREGHHGNFDTILLTDVYEHLPQPVALVRMLAGRLKPGGWLAIVTGNADAIGERQFLAEFWYFRLPGHLLMLSERHVAWLAQRLGLIVQSLERCSHYDTPLTERLRQWAQAFAYRQFRRSSRGVVTALLRFIPRLRQAERWPTAPALTCGPDHVVAILKNPSS